MDRLLTILRGPFILLRWVLMLAWHRLTLRRMQDRSYEGTEVYFLIRQLGALSKPGVDLPAGLRALAQGFRSWRFRKAVLDIAKRVEAGSSLFDAFARHPRYFDRSTLSVLRSAQKNGNLAELVADRSARLKVASMRGLQSLFFYLLWVGGFSALVVVFLMVKVIPTFEDVFDSFGACLPAITRLVIALSRLAQHLWLGVLVALVIGFFMLRFAVRRRALWLEKLLLALPGLNRMLEANRLGQSLSILRSALRAGTPLPEALDQAAEAAGPIYERGLKYAAERIRKGEGAMTVLGSATGLPPLFRWYFEAGAEQDLAQVVSELADLYEDRFNGYMDNLPVVLETTFCVVLGLVVGFLAVAMFMPMFSLGNVIQL